MYEAKYLRIYTHSYVCTYVRIHTYICSYVHTYALGIDNNKNVYTTIVEQKYISLLSPLLFPN